ncbi:MAG: hypothetical protein V7646_5663 [Pseudonocardia sp.]
MKSTTKPATRPALRIVRAGPRPAIGVAAPAIAPQAVGFDLPFRGRAAELSAVRAGLSALARGQGTILVVRGGPGAGRSRLLAEARRLAQAAGVRSFCGIADRNASMMPFGAVMDAFLGGPDPVLDAKALRPVAGSPDLRFLLVQTIREQLAKAAVRAPLLVTIDDLQWADGASHLVLRTVPARLASHPVMWVLAVRSTAEAGAVQTTMARLAEAGMQVIDLQPLDADAVGSLTHDVFGHDVDEAVRDLARRACGEPLLLVELLRGLAEQILRAGRGGRYRQLPHRFRRLVSQQLGCLSDTARRTLQIASVLGPNFTVRELETLLDRPASALLEPLGEAVFEGLVVAQRDAFAFRHELVREAIQEDLPADLVRRLRHQAVDAELRAGRPPEDVVSMLVDAALPGDAAAVALLRQAASGIAATDPTRAADLSVQAMALASPTGADRGELIGETAQLLLHAGRPAQAIALAEQSLQCPLDPTAEARLRMITALITVRAADLSSADAIRQCRIALDLPGVNPPARAELLAVLALATVHTAGPGAATEAVAEALAVARRTGSMSAEALAVAVAAMINMQRCGWEACLAGLEDAAILTTRVPVAHRLCVPQVWTAMVLAAAGRVDDALALADMGRREAEAHGSTALVRWWVAIRSQLLLDAGRPADARAEAQIVLDMVDDLGVDVAEFTVRSVLGRVALHTGDADGLATAEVHACRMIDSSSAVGRGMGRWLAALIADHRGEHERALQLASGAGTHPQELEVWPGRPLDPAADATFVRIALQADCPELAAKVVAEAGRRAAKNPGIPVLVAAYAHAHGLFVNDPHELNRAASLLAGSQRPLACASAQEDAGRLGAARNREHAIGLLEAAMRTYEEAGAHRDAARVRSRLRELGVHRRRTTRPGSGQGWQALTPTELDVVRLVADGATNRAAAEQLYVSPHTVSTHLRHAFTKLGITSRNELIRIALSRAEAVTSCPRRGPERL